MLSQLLGKFIHRNSKTTDKDRIANLSRLEQSKHYLLKVASRSDPTIDHMASTRINISTIDRNIDSLTTRIADYVDTIKSKEALVSANFYTEYFNITLDTFFIDEDGCYISTTELNKFINISKQLYEVLDIIKETDPGTYAYANRLLTKTFTSIQNVSVAVIEASD